MLGNIRNPNLPPFIVFGKYDFKAEECDEITFKRGDPILVLEKDDEHKDGWWKGKTVNKSIGLFPVEFTTFINVKQINIDGLFEELNGSAVNHRESLKTNISSIVSNYNMEVSGNISPHPSLNEVHTPKMNLAESNISSNSPSRYSGRMSISSASGINSISSQIMQSPVRPMSSHISLDHVPINKHKKYQAFPPSSWTVENVADWLEEVGFGACNKIFKENNIDGVKLLGQNLASLRELGINQLKDRLKLFNSIVSLKEYYAQLEQEHEREMNTSMLNEPSRQWEQHSRLYDSKYIIEEEPEDSINNDSMSVSSVLSNNTRRNDYMNSVLAESRKNARQINGPVGMRPRINSLVSQDSIQLTNTNLNYYRSMQRSNRAPSQSSKSSISSISHFFKRLSFSRSSSKKDTLLFEPMFQQADYQGWLWTRFNKSSKWKKRWVILSKEFLYFLKEPKHPINIKHTIQLNITFSIQPDIHKGKTKYTFNLIDSANQDITYFSADNHLVMMTWINVLVRATTNTAPRLQQTYLENRSPAGSSSRQSLLISSPVSLPVAGMPPVYGIQSQMISSPNSLQQYKIQQSNSNFISNSNPNPNTNNNNNPNFNSNDNNNNYHLVNSLNL